MFDKNNPRFYYFRKTLMGPPNKDGKRRHRTAPIACIAYWVDRDLKIITYGLSITNPKDKFDRQIAREIAKGRYDQKPRVFNYSGLDADSLDKNNFPDIAKLFILANTKGSVEGFSSHFQRLLQRQAKELTAYWDYQVARAAEQLKPKS